MRRLLKAWLDCCIVVLIVASVLGAVPSLGNHHDFNTCRYEYAGPGLVNVQRLLCTAPTEEVHRATVDVNHLPALPHPILVGIGILSVRPSPPVRISLGVRRPVFFHRRLALSGPPGADPLI